MIHRTSAEIEHGRQCHIRMQAMLAREFPDVSVNIRRAMQNKVARVIKTSGVDVIQAWVSSKPLHNAQYTADKVISIKGHKVYIQIQVD